MAFLFRNKIGFIYDSNGKKHLVSSKIFQDNKWNFVQNFIGENVDANAIANLAIADVAIVNLGEELIKRYPAKVGEAIVGQANVGVSK